MISQKKLKEVTIMKKFYSIMALLIAFFALNATQTYVVGEVFSRNG